MPYSPESDLYQRRAPQSPPRSRSYKVLCVSSLHPKASDDVVRDMLYREYKKFGDVSVRIVMEPDERVAFVYFHSSEDARDAKQCKSRIILFDKPVLVEPVYETRPSSSSSSGLQTNTNSRSYRHRSRSPIQDEHESYRGNYKGGHVMPRNYYQARSRPYYRPNYGHYYASRGYRGGERGGYHHDSIDPYNTNNHIAYSNAEKFPNYLDHISPEDDALATRTLFVGNLEINISEEEIRTIFGRFGTLIDVDIKRPKMGNAYAFIRYENLDQSHSAKVELSGQYIGQFQCKIGYGKANPSAKVWVGGLGDWASLSLLEREFDRFGAIQKIDYAKGDTSATILFESLDAAQAAVQEMRGFPLGGENNRLRIDFADVENPDANADHSSDAYYDYTRGSRGRPYYRGQHYIRRPSMTYRGDWGGRRFSHHYGYDVHRPMFNMYRSGSGETLAPKRSPKSISEYCLTIPKVWEGGLILKNSVFPAKLYLVEGDGTLVDHFKDEDGHFFLKITQRLRLDQSKLDDVTKRMESSSSSHCIFLALTTSFHIDVAECDELQSRPLRNLVAYLKQKEAAGVVSLISSSSKGVLYCFPPDSSFATDLIKRNAPSSLNESTTAEREKEEHLVLVAIC